MKASCSYAEGYHEGSLIAMLNISVRATVAAAMVTSMRASCDYAKGVREA